MCRVWVQLPPILVGQLVSTRRAPSTGRQGGNVAENVTVACGPLFWLFRLFVNSIVCPAGEGFPTSASR